MDTFDKDKLIKILNEKKANLPCPRCGNKSFVILGGYINQTIQKDLDGITLGGPGIPSIVTICDNCGYLSQHALGALGLLVKNKGDGQKK